MSDRVYRTGLIVIIVAGVILTPLTATQTVPTALGLATWVALTGWIVSYEAARRRRRQEHDANSH
ncbi:hypothetical protein QCD70_12910 [Agreia sp. PsM10]|uniref:hypothetical protein n=1 Tax=Agreia sp. PsM10 TaxID=3030533 RepID=UPI00263B5D3C|nr:hypothetical protein [Agreia sp. PsM10]MDN4641151.1 hypothetical protein [Agreia sp. PsM10]